jgi:hypothetical protein
VKDLVIQVDLKMVDVNLAHPFPQEQILYHHQRHTLTNIQVTVSLVAVVVITLIAMDKIRTLETAHVIRLK